MYSYDRTAAQTQFFVVPAPGYYDDQDWVYSAHSTAEQAWRAVGKSKSYVVRKGDLKKGARWRRVYEETYPLVPR